MLGNVFGKDSMNSSRKNLAFNLVSKIFDYPISVLWASAISQARIGGMANSSRYDFGRHSFVMGLCRQK
jgi:hypothetical protein